MKGESIGIMQAAKHGVTKPCPKDGGKPMLFAGDGMYDYLIICNTCGFQIHRSNLRATIERWRVATERAKSEK